MKQLKRSMGVSSQVFFALPVPQLSTEVWEFGFFVWVETVRNVCTIQSDKG